MPLPAPPFQFSDVITPSGAALRGLAYVGGNLVVLDYNGDVLTSADGGDNWSFAQNIAGQFGGFESTDSYVFVQVYVHPNYELWRSADGVSWAKVHDGGQLSVSAASPTHIYGYQNGAYRRSVDGVTWQAVSLDVDIHVIASSGPVQVAMTGNGLMRSTDGVNFSAVPDSDTVRGVVWSESGSRFVRVRQPEFGETVVEASADGLSWTYLGTDEGAFGSQDSVQLDNFTVFNKTPWEGGGGYIVLDDANQFYVVELLLEDTLPFITDAVKLADGTFVVLTPTHWSGGQQQIRKLTIGDPPPLPEFWTNFNLTYEIP